MNIEDPLKSILESEEKIDAKQKELDYKFREGTFSDDELGKIEEERDLLKKDKIHDEALVVNSLVKNKEDVDTAIKIVNEELSIKKNKSSLEIKDNKLNTKDKKTGIENNKEFNNINLKTEEIKEKEENRKELKGLKLKKQLDNLEQKKEKQKNIKKIEHDKAIIEDLAKDKKDVPIAVELLKEKQKNIEKRNKERYGIDDNLLESVAKGFGNTLGSVFGVRIAWEWKKLRSDIHDKKKLKESTLELLNVDVSKKVVEKLSFFNEKLKKVSLPEAQKKELRSRMAKVLSEHRHSKENLDKEKLRKIDRVFDVYINNSSEAMVVAREAVNAASVIAMMPWLRGVGYTVFAGASGLAKISNEYDKKYFDNLEKIGTTGKILSMAKTITVDSIVNTYNGLAGNFYRKNESGQKMGFKKALGGFVSTLVSVGTFAMRVGAVAEFEHMLASGNLLAKEGSEKLLDALKEGKVGQAIMQGGKNWLNNADRLLSYFGVHIGGNTGVDTIKNSIEDIKDDPKFLGVIKQGGDVDHTALAIGKAAGISNTKIVEALNNTFVKDINGNMIPLSKAELVQAGVKLKYIQGENGKSFFEVLLPKGGGGFADKEVYHNMIKDNGERLSRSVNSFGQYKISFNDIHKDNINLNGKLDLDQNNVFSKNSEHISNIIYKDGHIVNTNNPEIVNGSLDLHNNVQIDNSKADIAKDVIKNNVISNSEVSKNIAETIKVGNSDVRFYYDKAGEIINCNFQGTHGIAEAIEKQNYLVNNYTNVLINKNTGINNIEVADSIIRATVTKIYVYKHTIEELIKSGKENSKEVEFLRFAIVKNISNVESKYGKVFKSLPEILKIKTK